MPCGGNPFASLAAIPITPVRQLEWRARFTRDHRRSRRLGAAGGWCGRYSARRPALERAGHHQHRRSFRQKRQLQSFGARCGSGLDDLARQSQRLTLGHTIEIALKRYFKQSSHCEGPTAGGSENGPHRRDLSRQFTSGAQPADPAQVGCQNVRQDHRSVFLLAVFQHRDQGPAHGHARAVQRVQKLRSTTAPRRGTGLSSGGPGIAAVRDRADLAVPVLPGQPDFDIMGL